MRDHEDGTAITWVGLFVNLGLGGLKTAAGWWLGSKALIADGLHSLLDLLSDGVVLFGLSMAKRPEDESHHFGHHKFNSLAKFFIGGALLVFALALVVSAVMELHVGGELPQAGPAVVIVLFAMAVKEALFLLTLRTARRIKSELLQANAWHHRTDSISSLGVGVALTGMWIGGPEWAFLDGAVTLVLGCYLIFEASRIFFRACSELLDAAPERTIVEDLREHILPTPGARAYHNFRVRRVGDVFEVDLHLQVDPQITVEHGHAIAKEVKERILSKHPEVSKVLVHVEPANTEHIVERGISDVREGR